MSNLNPFQSIQLYKSTVIDHITESPLNILVLMKDAHLLSQFVNENFVRLTNLDSVLKAYPDIKAWQSPTKQKQKLLELTIKAVQEPLRAIKMVNLFSKWSKVTGNTCDSVIDIIEALNNDKKSKILNCIKNVILTFQSDLIRDSLNQIPDLDIEESEVVSNIKNQLQELDESLSSDSLNKSENIDFTSKKKISLQDLKNKLKTVAKNKRTNNPKYLRQKFQEKLFDTLQ
ncbi:MAG: hypothetical protein MHPSP_001016 [Paramarteilia canceri]